MKIARKFLIIGSLMILCFAFCGSCSSKSNDKVKDNEHVSHTNINHPTNKQCEETPVKDTTFGKWSVKTIKKANGVIVGSDEWAVADSSVYLTVSYDGKLLLSNKEIRTKDILGEEGEYFMSWGGTLEWYSDNAIYLSFACFIPDTDIGSYSFYKVSKDGSTDKFILADELGVTGLSTVSEFMTLYLSERGDGVAVKDLKPLFDRYCTSDLAQKLLDSRAVLDAGSVDHKKALASLIINEANDASYYIEDNDMNPFFATFETPHNTTDSLYITVEVDNSRCKIHSIEHILK